MNPPKVEGQIADDVDISQMPKEHFNDISLKEVWGQYVKKLRVESKENLATALMRADIVLSQDYKIMAKLDNTIQLDMVNEIRSEILDFLRNKLQNWTTTLKLDVKKAGESKSGYLLPKELYGKLAEDHPALEMLKKTFNLEIDF